MNLKTLLEDQNRFILEELDLVTHQGSDTNIDTRFFEISKASEQIALHFRLEQKYLYPVLDKNPANRPLLDKIKKDTETVLTLLEKIPMMHMDEPDLRRYLMALRKTFAEYVQENEALFFQHLCDDLSEEQCSTLAGEINQRLTHDMLTEPTLMQ